jgi:hypothetical protein
VDVEIHIFFTSVYYLEVSGHLHVPAALPPEVRATGTHWIGGWVGPRAGLDEVEKKKFVDLSVIQHVASRFTD